MALTSEKSDSDGRRRSLFKLPFRNSSDHQATSSSSSSHLSDNYIHQSRHFRYHGPRPVVERLGQTHHQPPAATIPSMSSVTRSLLPTKRRLKLDPSSKLYFPYEPGKQVRSAIKIKNTSKSHVSEEQVMRVVFLDPENPNPVMEKLKSQLAEADAADEARKKAPEVISSGPKPIGEGLVIDEWKQRRERYLAQQQGGLDLA
ncbi:unnamed protein product [Brassica rapa subsp. trilocularis]